MREARLARVAAILIAVCGALACEDSDPFRVEVTNQGEQFFFGLEGEFPGATASQEFVWQNTGRMARVTLNSRLTGGAGVFTIWDSIGQLVFTGNLAAIGSFRSDSGAVGAWVIRVDTNSLIGTVNLWIQTTH
jgi:hypothetical protein